MELTQTTSQELPGCTIALKCADDPSIERCLDSIDDDVSVFVAITPSDRVEGILRERDVPYAVTEYGNIAKSTEISVQEAETDHVIVMDSDAWFVPGSIRMLREALTDNVMAKARLEFISDSPVSNLIARNRARFNNVQDYVTNPGLAMRRAEVQEQCDGYIFNPKIRWTEDADLNYRAQKAGITLAYLPEAVVRHEAMTLRHDLKAAFLYGIGKRLSIEHTPGREPYEEFPDIAISALKGMLPKNVYNKVQTLGGGGALLDTAWQGLYLAGYHAQKRTGQWSVEA